MEQLNYLLKSDLRAEQKESNKPFKLYKKSKFINKPYDFVAKNEYLQIYIKELQDRNASCIREHYGNIGYFLRYLHNHHQIKDLKTLSLDMARAYDNHLIQRVENKEIKRISALRKVRFSTHFINFLQRINVIDFSYRVSMRFKGDSVDRENEYVSNQERLAFLNTIIRHNGRYFSRDMAICLLLIDTGCRPIEIAGLTVNDFDTIESAIVLNSKKSGQRKLKIHPFVCKFLKQYLNDRVSIPGNSLFLLSYGEPINKTRIINMVREYVKMAFGEPRFSAKSLRHTCITNQLNNRNDIRNVAQAAGHKHLVSTFHYFYRDVEMLLDHSLPYNPLEGIDEQNEL